MKMWKLNKCVACYDIFTWASNLTNFFLKLKVGNIQNFAIGFRISCSLSYLKKDSNLIYKRKYFY